MLSDANLHGRVGARVHPVTHPAFAQDVATLVGRAGARLAYLMVPKPRDLADVAHACTQIAHAQHAHSDTHSHARPLPVHALIETHGALRDVERIAAHPGIESLSFGLMDFVSAHRGAIPAAGMSVAGQFTHPLVVRAKLEIAAACHLHAKVPSHCVVTEFEDLGALRAAATRAAREFGYTRMWSIHPNQIRAIVDAFAPRPGGDRHGHRDRRRRAERAMGADSVTARPCTTAPAIVTSGRCWSARSAPAGRCRRRSGSASSLRPPTSERVAPRGRRGIIGASDNDGPFATLQAPT